MGRTNSKLSQIHLLPVKPTVSRVSPCDSHDNERQDNVTVLDYEYYSHIRS